MRKWDEADEFGEMIKKREQKQSKRQLPWVELALAMICFGIAAWMLVK
jgi:hypothetical protein